jgi:signal transduction histidine kinase
LIANAVDRAAREDDGTMSPVDALAARVLRFLRSLRQHPLIGDSLVLGIVLALGLLPDLFGPGTAHNTAAWAFDLGLTLPLLFRRRAPFAVFLVQAAVALAQWGADIRVGADFALLVSLNAVGVYASRRITVAYAAVIAQLGVFLFAYEWAPSSNLFGATVLLSGTVAASWVLGVYVRTRRAYINGMVERAQSAEQERDTRALIAVAEERARISREMHDIVAHSLAVMIALGDGAAAAISRSPAEAQQAMEQSSALGRQSLQEIRRVLGDLRGAEELERAPQPGIEALEDLVRQVRGAGLPVDLVVVGQPQDLVPSAQLAVYRLVQESLTNVLKHARHATRATVILRYLDSGVQLEIDNDDRPDPDNQSGAPSAGHGIAGMRERAAVFNGDVEAARRPDGGWRVVSRLQLAGAEVTS